METVGGPAGRVGLDVVGDAVAVVGAADYVVMVTALPPEFYVVLAGIHGDLAF